MQICCGRKEASLLLVHIAHTLARDHRMGQGQVAQQETFESRQEAPLHGLGLGIPMAKKLQVDMAERSSADGTDGEQSKIGQAREQLECTVCKSHAKEIFRCR